MLLDLKVYAKQQIQVLLSPWNLDEEELAKLHRRPWNNQQLTWPTSLRV